MWYNIITRKNNLAGGLSIMLEIGAVVTNGVMEAASQKSGDGILLVLAIVLGLICPPIGFILMMIFVFR